MSKHPKSKLPKRKNTKISSAHDLTKTGKSGDIELDEKELEQVSGGATTHENVTVKVGRIEFKV